jgi:nickel-dependent lactate racemase
MAEPVQLVVGSEPWALTVPPARAIALKREPFTAPTALPQQLVHDALEKPFHFEALRRALTPDDHVTIVIDPRLPHLAEMLAEVLRHLGSAGVSPEAVTVVSPPNSPETWIDELPDEFADVTAEMHDPSDPKKLAYLATTKGGRRVYLNRSLVEADFIIALTGRRFDPARFYAGAEVALFPELSNEETRAASAGPFTRDAPWHGREEAQEVAWLLGTPFFVQVIEGEGDTVQEVVAGLVESSAEGKHRQDARWRATVSDRAEVVVAAVSGERGRITFLDLARAAANAARVAQPGGRIVLLTDAAPNLGEAMEWVRAQDEPKAPTARLAHEKPADWADWADCKLWCFAAGKVGVFLASGYPDEVAEELFATPIHTPSEVQRLIDSAASVIVIPDAHKVRVTVEQAHHDSEDHE